MAFVYFIIGGNEGERQQNLAEARTLISQNIGPIISKSDIYETEPWGFEAEQNFWNQALLVETNFLPLQLLDKTIEIERQLGRTRKSINSNYASRTMDIDIIFYDSQIIDNEQLTIPHPRITLRNFVLQPLLQIAPNFVHPILGKTISQLAQECSDEGKIWQIFSM